VAKGISEWVRQNVTCPGTMVDRIVPATTASTVDLAARTLGVHDRAAVNGEPYLAWVIEDDFPAGRPAWEQAGAVMTGDTRPWETLKLRTLNGVHSAIAYLGAVAGRETVAAALELPGMAGFLRQLIAEDIAPSLVPPPGVDTVAYGEQVLARYVGVGEMFGCIALFGDRHYPGSAEGVLPSLALTWDGPVTAGLIERNPRIALNAMHTLADRVHELQARYQELATERVERRVAHAVLRLARDAGVQVAEGVRVSFPLSRQDLAEMTGTTLFSVSRTLSAWERAGLVDAGRQELVIRDAEGLLEIAETL